jgi:hypothetical protein
MVEIILNIHHYIDVNSYENIEEFNLIKATIIQNFTTNIKHQFLNEAICGFELGTWSSTLFLYAIANAMSIHIQQVFPKLADKQQHLANNLIKPFLFLKKSCLSIYFLFSVIILKEVFNVV